MQKEKSILEDSRVSITIDISSKDTSYILSWKETSLHRFLVKIKRIYKHQIVDIFSVEGLQPHEAQAFIKLFEEKQCEIESRLSAIALWGGR